MTRGCQELVGGGKHVTLLESKSGIIIADLQKHLLGVRHRSTSFACIYLFTLYNNSRIVMEAL